MSLTTRIVMLGLMVMVVLMLGVGGLAYWTTFQAAKRELGTGQKVSTEETMRKIERFLQERHLDVQELSSGSRFLGGDLQVIQVYVDEVLALAGVWRDIWLMDLNGETLVTSGKAEENILEIHAKVREAYTRALDGEVVYTDLLGEDPVSRYMYWAAPVRASAEEGREIERVLVLSLSEQVINELLQKDKGREQTMFLIDKNGVVIGSDPYIPDHLALHGQTIGEEYGVLIGDFGVVYELSTLAGRSSSLTVAVPESGYLDYHGNDWHLMSQVPMEVVTLEVRGRVVPMLWSMSGVVALLVLGLVFYMENWVVRPVKEITRVAKQMGEGEVESRVVVKSRDELGQLGEAFNRMMDRLQESHRLLEERVAERTVKLKKAMDAMVGREKKMREMKLELKKLGTKVEEDR